MIFIEIGVAWLLEPWFDFDSNFFVFFEFKKWQKPAERTGKLR